MKKLIMKKIHEIFLIRSNPSAEFPELTIYKV